MKLLFLSRKWPPAVGGMEIYCRELVRGLRDRVELDLRVLPGRGDGRPPTLPALTWYGLATGVRLLLRPTAAEVVHGGDLAIWPLVWLATLWRPDIRPVLSAHGTDIALAHRSGAAAWLYRGYIGLGALLLRRAVVLANSQATARLCTARGFPTVRVIPLAARLGEDVVPTVPEPYVLFVGRLARRKGCAWFIANVLPMLDPPLRLVVAGVAWGQHEAQALRHPRVEFRGAVHGAELAKLRAQATAVVVPNLAIGMDGFEGFGLAATEGAADGGVVLAAAVDGIVDAVRDGETGFLLPAGDAESWAAKINEVAHWQPAQRRAFVERARDVVGRFYCWERVADETLDAYRRRLDTAPAGGASWNRFRRWALLVACAAFVAGLVWAMHDVSQVWRQVAFGPLALLLLVGVPAAIALNAAEFRAIAEAGGKSTPWSSAFEISIYTSAANMLPLPGGVIARLAGLRARGIGARQGTWLVLLFAGVWAGAAFLLSGAAIAVRNTALAAPCLTIGLGALAASIAGLRRHKVRFPLIGRIMLIRAGLLATDTLRIFLAVAALGTLLTPMAAAVFSVSSFIGTFISVVPAGLGVTEGVVALLSPVVGLDPALGFLSAAVNRLFGMAGLALAASLLLVLSRRRHGRKLDLPDPDAPLP